MARFEGAPKGDEAESTEVRDAIGGQLRRVEYHRWRNILVLWRLASRRPTVSRMDRVAIRQATSSDVLALLEMMAFFNAAEEIPWSAAVIEPALRHLLASPELGFVLVAMVGQKDVGYAVATFNYDLEFAGRDAFVTELFVRSEHRRSGVARRLLAAIEANAGIEGTRALHLLVLPDNHVALRLYETAGFGVSPRLMLTKRVGG